MRRVVMLASSLLLAAASLTAVATPAAAQGDVQAFCQTRLDANAAFAQEDRAAVRTALEAIQTSAPPEVQQPAASLAELFARRGPAAFETKKGARAANAIDEFVVASCGFPVSDVSAIDYEFQDVPATLVAGPQVLQFTNDAPKEQHEMVLLRVNPDVDLSPRKLLALPEKKLAKRAEVVGAAFAFPGDADTLIASLEPGRYVYACFIEVGTTSGGDDEHAADEHGGDEHAGAAKPHWKQGMYGALEVVGVA
jgi:hypothetical protein